MARTKSTHLPRRTVVALLGGAEQASAVDNASSEAASEGAPSAPPEDADAAPGTPVQLQAQGEHEQAPRAPKAARGPTVLQRMPRLAKDTTQLAAWKVALAWAKDRAPDHVVHQRHGDGRTRERSLFEDYDLGKASGYTDGVLKEMLDFFVLAQMQYREFL